MVIDWNRLPVHEGHLYECKDQYIYVNEPLIVTKTVVELQDFPSCPVMVAKKKKIYI